MEQRACSRRPGVWKGRVVTGWGWAEAGVLAGVGGAPPRGGGHGAAAQGSAGRTWDEAASQDADLLENRHKLSK